MIHKLLEPDFQEQTTSTYTFNIHGLNILHFDSFYQISIVNVIWNISDARTEIYAHYKQLICRSKPISYVAHLNIALFLSAHYFCKDPHKVASPSFPPKRKKKKIFPGKQSSNKWESLWDIEKVAIYNSLIEKQSGAIEMNSWSHFYKILSYWLEINKRRHSQKDRQDEKGEGYIPDEGTR